MEMPQVEKAGTLGGWGFKGYRFVARRWESQISSQAYETGEQEQLVNPINVYQRVRVSLVLGFGQRLVVELFTS